MAIGVMTLDEMSELRSASVMMWICHIDDFTYTKKLSNAARVSPRVILHMRGGPRPARRDREA